MRSDVGGCRSCSPWEGRGAESVGELGFVSMVCFGEAVGDARTDAGEELLRWCACLDGGFGQDLSHGG
jgi:hypothetical protein